MRLFRLLLLILGLTFLIFGYEIYFKEKYKLVNNFENGLKDEKYAKKVGFIELIIGIAILLCFIILY